MRSLHILSALTFLIAIPAFAQLGLYGTFNAERMSAPANTAATNNNIYQASSGTILQLPANAFVPLPTNPIGGTGGVYYDFRTLGPVRIGVDARGSIVTTKRGAQPTANGGGARINSVLGGVRGVFHTRYEALRPYVELAGGLGSTNYGIFYNDATHGVELHNGFEYHAFAGLDVRLSSYLDLRAVELGYGGVTTSGPSSGVGPFTLKSVGVGMVVHLPSLP